MRAAAVLVVALLAACGPGRESFDPAAKAAAEAKAEKAVAALASSLQRELKAALEAGGPSGAIPVCSEKAPEVAKGLSQQGLAVRRTSLRWRSAENAPDEFERMILEQWKTTGKPEILAMVTDGPGGRELRYMKPIVVQPVCLACHGPSEELAPDVKREIARLYPQDHATGFRDGDLRGAFSVRVAMPE